MTREIAYELLQTNQARREAGEDLAIYYDQLIRRDVARELFVVVYGYARSTWRNAHRHLITGRQYGQRSYVKLYRLSEVLAELADSMEAPRREADPVQIRASMRPSASGSTGQAQGSLGFRV